MQMENIMQLYSLYIEYLREKGDQCMRITDWNALERAKEIMEDDFIYKCRNLGVKGI